MLLFHLNDVWSWWCWLHLTLLRHVCQWSHWKFKFMIFHLFWLIYNLIVQMLSLLSRLIIMNFLTRHCLLNMYWTVQWIQWITPVLPCIIVRYSVVTVIVAAHAWEVLIALRWILIVLEVSLVALYQRFLLFSLIFKLVLLWRCINVHGRGGALVVIRLDEWFKSLSDLIDCHGWYSLLL